MKKTTIAILAAIAFGAVAASLGTAIVFDFGNSTSINITLDSSADGTTTRQLKPFHTIKFDKDDRYAYFSNTEIIAIKVSETATTPSIQYSSQWENVIKTQIANDGVMTLSFNYSAIENSQNSNKSIYIHNIDDTITITLPPRILRAIQIPNNKINNKAYAIQNFIDSCLRISGGVETIKMSNSQIAELTLRAEGMHYETGEFSLDKTVVTNMKLECGAQQIALETDSLSRIDRISCTETALTGLRLDIQNANVGQLDATGISPAYGCEIITSTPFTATFQK